MAILIEIRHVHHLLLDKLRHPVPHSLGDVRDHRSILLLQSQEHRRHARIILHQILVVLLPAIRAIIRIVNVLVKRQQIRHLLLDRYAHVVLHRVQRSKHEIKHAHRVSQLRVQPLNHDRERSRHLIQHVVAVRQIRILRQSLRRVRHHLHPHQRRDVPRVRQHRPKRPHPSRRASRDESATGSSDDRSAIESFVATRAIDRVDSTPDDPSRSAARPDVARSTTRDRACAFACFYLDTYLEILRHTVSYCAPRNIYETRKSRPRALSAARIASPRSSRDR